MSTRSEALSPGISWNATRAASVLLVTIIAVIALVFWPSFEPARPAAPVARETTGLAAPHQPILVDGKACVQCRPPPFPLRSGRRATPGRRGERHPRTVWPGTDPSTCGA